MKSAPFLLTLPLLLAVSCSSLKKSGEPAEVATGKTPEAARPEDVTKVDEIFKSKKASYFHPPADKTPTLTPQNTAYVVELDQQRVYLYYGSELIAASRIASGRAGYRTETGKYVIGQKNQNHRSNIYGSYVSSTGSTMMGDVRAGFDPTPAGARFVGASMKYFQRFVRPDGTSTAMGFHQGHLPGYPASHGCVRLPGSAAAWFFQHVPKGTPVYVRGTKYGVPYGKSQARPKRAPKVHPSLKKTVPETAPQTEPAGAEAGDATSTPSTSPAPAQTAPIAPPATEAPTAPPTPVPSAPPAPAPVTPASEGF